MKSEKVLVTGNAGCGKTTLSHKLSESLNLPRYGLDSIVWQPHWKKTSEKEKNEKIQKILDTNAWIIDGVSSQVFRVADQIYFLDFSLARSLLNIFKRFLKTGVRTRADLPAGCSEIFGVFKAVKVAIKYQKYTRPRILDLISAHPEKKIHWIKNFADLQKLQCD